MADGGDETKSVVRRSRAGCAECRRRRRRCDEKKPACSYCVSTEQQCKYVVKLSWGGRPFSRSIFGQCLDIDDGVAKIGTEAKTTSRQPFVYGTKSQQNPIKNSDGHETVFISIVPTASETDPEHEDTVHSKIEFINSNPSKNARAAYKSAKSRESPRLDFYKPSDYAWIPPQHRNLIDYFTERMTRSISCYNVVQNQYCSTLLPMATSSPHLLSAVLYLAATHRTSRGLEQSPYETACLRDASLQQLRHCITSPDINSIIETTIASTLTLCIADIISEVAQDGSWRFHLQGALSLWNQMIKDPSYKGKKETIRIQFLKRWYTSFETIAFGCGLVPLRKFMSHIDEDEPPGEDDHYIDDICSFSTRLLPVLEEVNKLKASMTRPAVHKRRLGGKVEEPVPFDYEAANKTCQILIKQTEELLATRTPKFRDGVSHLIPEKVKGDYFILDGAYHHMALLQIYTLAPLSAPTADQPARSPIAADTVRASVVSIIKGVKSLTFVDDACPAVAILPPLFVAGSQTWEKEDQDMIMAILKDMEDCWGMGNVRASRDMLLRIWEAQEMRQDARGPFRWDLATGEDCDILPY